MNAAEVQCKIRDLGIVPVVRTDDASAARDAIEALVAAGITVIEITMTVPNAIALIREQVAQYERKLLIGAGTVTTTTQANHCLDGGAEFLVSPGLFSPILRLAQAKGKLAIPGVLSPTEIMAAHAEGMDLMKVFPCGSVGGPKYIKSLKGPFPQLNFIPTGGVSISNTADYIAAGAFALGAGADLVDTKALREGNTAQVSNAAREFLSVIQKARLMAAK
jgi:2-dehydro-3-deoxyphosphogluconate aldolase / (4S)-4-hydroxy-2-oxoglutarate aldolase